MPLLSPQAGTPCPKAFSSWREALVQTPRAEPPEIWVEPRRTSARGSMSLPLSLRWAEQGGMVPGACSRHRTSPGTRAQPHVGPCSWHRGSTSAPLGDSHPEGSLHAGGPRAPGASCPLVPAAPRCPLGRCRGSGWVLCPGAGGPVDAMCLFVLGGECCSPARGGTGTRMALRSLPSLNLHCLTAGALLTSIPWLWGLFGEEWASLRIRLLVGLPEKHSTETTEGEGGEEGTERGAWHESCCSAQPQELSADSRLGLPAWVPSLVGRKVPPNTSSWPRSAA